MRKYTPSRTTPSIRKTGVGELQFLIMGYCDIHLHIVTFLFLSIIDCHTEYWCSVKMQRHQPFNKCNWDNGRGSSDTLKVFPAKFSRKNLAHIEQPLLHTGYTVNLMMTMITWFIWSVLISPEKRHNYAAILRECLSKALMNEIKQNLTNKEKLVKKS